MITPGTSRLVRPDLISVAVQGCADAGLRGVLVTPHDELVPSRLPAGVERFRFLDFSRYMPKMSTVIHHGGIGTVSRALWSGVPQLVMGHLTDGPYNAQLVERAGVGVSLPPGRWQATAVRDGLRRLMDASIRDRTRELARRMREEDGVTAAVDVLEEIARRPDEHRFPR